MSAPRSSAPAPISKPHYLAVTVGLVLVTLAGLAPPARVYAQDEFAARFKKWLVEYIAAARASQKTVEAEEVSKLLKEGNLDRARALLETQKSTLPSAGRLQQLLGEVKPDTVIRLRKAAELDVDQALGRLPPDTAAVFRPLEGLNTHVGAVSFVSTKVKFFCLKFADGYKNHAAILDHASERYRPLVEHHRSVPVERRIFLIGTGKDKTLIGRQIQQWEHNGYAVYFYELCEAFGPLCHDEIVGAFMGESGWIIVDDTPAAHASPYVFLEAATSQQLRAGEVRMTLVSPHDLMQAAANFGTAAAAATIQVTAVNLSQNP
jgi:hypothetical protein